jgi:hypothetical protein
MLSTVVDLDLLFAGAFTLYIKKKSKETHKYQFILKGIKEEENKNALE